MALHIGIGNFGGAIASNIYLSKDAPRYVLGRMSHPCIAHSADTQTSQL